MGPFLVGNELRQGNLGRNAIRGFGMSQADLGLRREFGLREGWKLQVKAEMFNFLNHPNFADPFYNLGSLSPTGVLTVQNQFGRSRSMLAQSFGTGGVNGGVSSTYQVGGPRSVQLSMKLVF